MKIPPRIVLSDDCVIHIGRVVRDGKVVKEGEPFSVHEGERVELYPVVTVQKAIVLGKLQADLVNPRGDIEATFDILCNEIASSVISWNWTDLQGRPLEQPSANPQVIKQLTEEEIVYLLGVISGESPGERKNALTPASASSTGTGVNLRNP